LLFPNLPLDLLLWLRLVLLLLPPLAVRLLLRL
jgi:hypothetical protein